MLVITKPMPPRSAPSLMKRESYRPLTSCAGGSQELPTTRRRELWAEAARYGDADSGQGRHAAGEGAQGTAQGGVARKLKKR